MQPEGMVHALEQVHRLLVPGGSLIDIHPALGPLVVEIHQQGKLVFAQPDPEDWSSDYRKADEAVAEILRKGLFRRIRRKQFEFYIYASSVRELCAYIDEVSGHEASTLEAATPEADFFRGVEKRMQGMGGEAQVATHERAHIALLKVVK
jgi:hypothetical protein